MTVVVSKENKSIYAGEVWSMEKRWGHWHVEAFRDSAVGLIKSHRPRFTITDEELAGYKTVNISTL